MTNEQLTAYLQDESYLYSLTYEELKTLVMQYPYAANLRILLLKKSHLEQNRDLDRNLQMAATYSSNRKFLFRLVKRMKAAQAAPVNVILGEDYLELTELSNIERILGEKHVSEVFAENGKSASLAADWKLDFGESDVSETPPTVFVDDDFDFALPMQIVDNQSFDDEEAAVDLLIGNLVSEFDSDDDGMTLDFSRSDFSTKNGESNRIEMPSETAHLDDIFSLEKIENETDWAAIFADDDLETAMNLSVEPVAHFEFEKENVLENALLDLEKPIENVAFGFEKPMENKAIELENVVEIPKENAVETAVETIIETPNSDISTPQYLEEKTAVLTETETENDVKRPDIELEITHDPRRVIVSNVAVPTAAEPSKLSFTEWLRQFRMNGNVAQTAKTETSEHSEVTDNQSFAVKEAHRKTMRENLAAVFENPNELPNNLFGLENNSEKRIENALDTEGSDSIKNFQLDIKNDHLETADSAETGELKKKKKKKVMHELAARSIEKDNELASETLADLHAFQGNVDKAVEMYRRLALAFPEKSDYFATKIKKLT